MVTSWVREQSSLTGDNQCFRKFCCIHLHFCSDNGSCRFLEMLVITNEAMWCHNPIYNNTNFFIAV